MLLFDDGEGIIVVFGHNTWMFLCELNYFIHLSDIFLQWCEMEKNQKQITNLDEKTMKKAGV